MLLFTHRVSIQTLLRRSNEALTDRAARRSRHLRRNQLARITGGVGDGPSSLAVRVLRPRVAAPFRFHAKSGQTEAREDEGIAWRGFESSVRFSLCLYGGRAPVGVRVTRRERARCWSVGLLERFVAAWIGNADYQAARAWNNACHPFRLLRRS